MNRRVLVKAMLTMSASSVLGSCKTTNEPGASSPPPSPETQSAQTVSASSGSLKVWLHGPFAVVIQTKNQNRIKAFVPFDAKKEHEFCFMSPDKVLTDRPSYEFTLDEAGVETSRRAPYIDRAFDAFNFKFGPWEPNPKQYFVALDLPAPDVITFIPPTESVVFSGKRVSTPIDHVFEYRIANAGKLSIRSQAGTYSPEPASTLLAAYQKHWREGKESMSRSADTQRADMQDELQRWAAENASVYLFGVGLPEKYNEEYRRKHAIEFFNNELRAAFPNSKELQAGRLERIDGYGCPPSRLAALGQGEFCGNDGEEEPPRLISAVLQGPRPRLLPISYTEDCRAFGPTGTTP